MKIILAAFSCQVCAHIPPHLKNAICSYVTLVSCCVYYNHQGERREQTVCEGNSSSCWGHFSSLHHGEITVMCQLEAGIVSPGFNEGSFFGRLMSLIYIVPKLNH